MESSRNAVLSTAYGLQSELQAAGWTNVTFVGEVPDDRKVHFYKDRTGEAGEVIIPAVYVGELFSRGGQRTGIGDPLKTEEVGIVVYLYAETPGQEKDLRVLMKDILEDKGASYYDFTDYGYPPSGVMVASGLIEYNYIRSSPAYRPGNVNAAVEFGGVIFATAIFEKPTRS